MKGKIYVVIIKLTSQERLGMTKIPNSVGSNKRISVLKNFSSLLIFE